MRSDLDFERLVDQHYAALYRFAFSLCGNESDASDLAQQTFYLLATKSHQIGDLSKTKSWLFTTLYRLFLGGHRRVVRFPHQELSQTEHELPEVLPEPPSRLDWQLATDSLRRLDEPFRSAVALFYLEDYSYNEIAGILQVPLGTVKSRIARGVGLLRKMMSERGKVGAKVT